MTGEVALPVTMADLFEPEPQRWGLRGDPYLWRALRDRLADVDVPASESEVVTLLHTTFAELAGVDLRSDRAPSVYLERFAHGGMSSGTISLDTWRQELIPLLTERAGAVLG